MKKMTYCRKCTYPQIAVNLEMESDGLCTSCYAFESFTELPQGEWDRRKDKMRQIIQEANKDNTSNYDCLVPVSGGKDSYYQTHVMVEEFGLKPLLVTYHGNNYLPEGDYNRDRMRHVFNADHVVFGPNVEVLKKLNRLCFRKMGDMNWHAHCGIFTFPIQEAVRHGIKLIIWGEIPWDISGMHDVHDYAEFSARSRIEHDLRGYDWHDMLGDEREPLTAKDLTWAMYPSDEEILRVGVRGIYVGNFFKWDPTWHAKMIQEKYGWKPAERDFERTYRKMSNLDDRYENGSHDFLKWIKFGYGRATDHTSKDIHMGYMTREQAIELVRKHDSVIPSDLYYWLEYVGMSQDEFWQTADTFRDPRVWWIDNGEWWKDNIWGEPSSYGKVHLPEAQWAKYLTDSRV